MSARIDVDAIEEDQRLLISSVVLCEATWLLETAYDYSRAEIRGTLERILDTAQFEIERAQEARQALGDFQSTKAGFADALIGRINRALGATHTATFDRDLKALETFTVL